MKGRRVRKAGLSWHDRLSAAVLGVFVGALIGLAAAWIFGVYSNRLGASRTVLDIKPMVMYTALGFGAVGLLFGYAVLDLLGAVIGLLFRFEDTEGDERRAADLPTWLVVVLLAAVVAAAVWWFA